MNAGSWMWLSCSAFFQQFFHCYCPVGFGRRTDPSGDYIRSACRPGSLALLGWGTLSPLKEDPSMLMGVRCVYFRRYLPKLKGFPSRYIYEPWNAPESIQKAAKCIIGVDYPRPIVNHAETSRLNIERMKQIYQQLSRYRGLCKELLLPSLFPSSLKGRAAPEGSQGLDGDLQIFAKGD